jgi:hypothetical protein
MPLGCNTLTGDTIKSFCNTAGRNLTLNWMSTRWSTVPFPLYQPTPLATLNWMSTRWSTVLFPLYQYGAQLFPEIEDAIEFHAFAPLEALPCV